MPIFLSVLSKITQYDEKYVPRPYGATLAARLRAEPRRFIQVVAGPRQAGKTTLVRQVLSEIVLPSIYASADEPTLRGAGWIEQRWREARLAVQQSDGRAAVLVLDEAQKVAGWSETVKRLWDEDTAQGSDLRVVVLGSAPLLIQRGLTESLAGRFELIRLPHWSFSEMRDAFGWTLEQFVFFGGYPGAAPLVGDFDRWASYIKDSLIETTIARDVLLLTRVDKPALLRRLFELTCVYSGQILSYQKMLGQLQEAGNTTTLAHYLDLLSAAGMAVGLSKFAGAHVRQRGSSPKLVVLNTALMSAEVGLPLEQIQRDGDRWGRLVESAVGAHLANAAMAGQFELFYWTERSREVDFVARSPRGLIAIEVKSGRSPTAFPGMTTFTGRYRPDRTFLVGSGGIPLGEFLERPATYWIGGAAPQSSFP